MSPLLRPVALLLLALAATIPAVAGKKSAPLSPPSETLSWRDRIDPENVDTSRLASAIFHETNRVRAQLGLPRFTSLSKLDATADLQANSVALSQVCGHTNLWPALTHLSDRINHIGLKPRLVAENVALRSVLRIDSARGYHRQNSDGGSVLVDNATGRPLESHTYASFAAAVVDAWMESPGHRANIVNPHFRQLGCSARSGRSLHGLMMLACVQVFYTPLERP